MVLDMFLESMSFLRSYKEVSGGRGNKGTNCLYEQIGNISEINLV